MRWLQVTIYGLLILFISGLCLLEYQILQVVPQIKKDYINIKSDLREVTEDWKKVSKTYSNIALMPRTQESIGLWLRSGDDLNRTVKRVNVTLDSLNQLITNTDKSLNQDTIPNVNSVVSKTGDSIQKTFLDLQGPIKESETLLKEATKLVADTNKNTTELTASVVNTTNTVNDTILENKHNVDSIMTNTEYFTARMGDIADATYEKLAKVHRWFAKLFLDVSSWVYRVFIRP